MAAGLGFRLEFAVNGRVYRPAASAVGGRQASLYHVDGSRTDYNTGHGTISLSADSPGGGSLIDYVGRRVVDVTADDVWTLRSSSGRSIDICRYLAP